MHRPRCVRETSPEAGVSTSVRCCAAPGEHRAVSAIGILNSPCTARLSPVPVREQGNHLHNVNSIMKGLSSTYVIPRDVSEEATKQ